MKLYNDDLDDLSGETVDLGCFRGDDYYETPDYPAEIELMGVLDDPLLGQELDLILDEAELMGIDLDDPELMGFFLKKLINKIKARFKKKKKAAPSPLAPTGLTLQTRAGTAKIGPKGVSFVGKRPLMVTPTGAVVAAQPPGPAAGFQEMLKNPMVIAGLVGVPLVLMMVAGRKKGRKSK